LSVLRLAGTTAAMALVAVALGTLTPELSVMTGALADAQRTADTAGPDALVLAAAGLLAWAVWTWGAVGLALTASTALPGLLGGTARLLLQGVLPSGARRSAALALGIGLSVSAPLVATAAGVPALPAASAAGAESAAGTESVVPDWPAARAGSVATVPDWPTTPERPSSSAVPDWPAGPDVTGAYVVVRGDCLWHIAAGQLLDQLGRPPDDHEIASAVQAWWRTNADVIGPDPDLLLPGQVLLPPERP
jgi:nucleoid-associated protein YgaU